MSASRGATVSKMKVENVRQRKSSTTEAFTFANCLYAAFHYIMGRLCHRAVIVTVEFVKMYVVDVSIQLHHAPEICLFLISSEEFQFSVAREHKHRHRQLSHVPKRSRNIKSRS